MSDIFEESLKAMEIYFASISDEEFLKTYRKSARTDHVWNKNKVGQVTISEYLYGDTFRLPRAESYRKALRRFVPLDIKLAVIRKMNLNKMSKDRSNGYRNCAYWNNKQQRVRG